MGSRKTWMSVAGWICHGLVGGIMLLACGFKASGMAPAPIVKSLADVGLLDKMQLIGAGGLVAAILMLIPRTMILGAMVTSAYWGGAISLHMEHKESYVLQSALVLLTWIGAILRRPSSFPFLDPLFAKDNPGT